ncbi:hypothetical protein, partial [Pseudoalteromonas sp. TAE80]
ALRRTVADAIDTYHSAGLIKCCDGTWLRPCNLTDSRQGFDALFLCSLSRRTTFFSEAFIKPAFLFS